MPYLSHLSPNDRFLHYVLFPLQAMLNEHPCIDVFGTLSVFLKDEFLEVVFLGQKKLCSIKMPRSTSKLLQDWGNLYSHRSVWKQLLHARVLLITASLTNEKWQPVGLIGVSLIVHETEKPLLCSLVLCISSENCMLILFLFFSWVCSFLICSWFYVH